MWQNFFQRLFHYITRCDIALLLHTHYLRIMYTSNRESGDDDEYDD